MRKILSLILAMVMMISLVACSSKTEENAVAEEAPAVENAVAEEEKTISGHITVAQHRTDLESEFSKMIEEFCKLYPEVEVEVETVADYQNTMAVRIAGGEVPDVVEIHNNMIPAASWGDYFASLEDCDLPEMLFEEYYSVDGVKYGACMATGYRCFVYNKELYEQAGITEVPTNWTEFMEAMEKLSALDGVIPMTSQYNTAWTQREWVDHYAASNHEETWKNSWVDTDEPFSDEMIIKCLDQYKSVIDGGYCEEDLMSSDWDLQAADFAGGTIATYCGGNYIYATMVGLGMDPENIGFYAFPALEEGGNTTLAAVVDWAWGMSKDVVGTEDYEAACALVNFLARNYADYTNQLTAVVGEECTIDAINEMLAQDPVIVSEVRSSEDFVGINNIAAINIGNLVQEYVTADDPMSVITDYNARWAAARAEYYGE